jgi:hypothetical protein
MDTESVLRSLNVRGVRYVVIGASAFPAHGYGRTTLDLDVLIEPTRENAERTRVALTDLGYDVTDVSPQEMLEKKILKALLAIRRLQATNIRDKKKSK